MQQNWRKGKERKYYNTKRGKGWKCNPTRYKERIKQRWTM